MMAGLGDSGVTYFNVVDVTETGESGGYQGHLKVSVDSLFFAFYHFLVGLNVTPHTC